MKTIKKDYEEFYMDENGNCWSKDKFTEEEAIEKSKTLINCFHCLNCENGNECHYCVECLDCDNCYKCVNCKNCKNCVKCIKCKDCENCRNCKNCVKCNDCHSCDNLTYKNYFINNNYEFDYEYADWNEEDYD